MNIMVAKRRCDYKGCNEYRDRTNLNPDIKFFSFPSDPERTKKWLKLSQTTTENPKFICSKHFEDKFISRVQRRVHLVISAVPIDYNTIISQPCDDIPNKFKVEETKAVSDDDDDDDHRMISDILRNDIITNETTQEQTSDDKSLGLKNQKQTNILLNSVPIKGCSERGPLLESMDVYNDDKSIQKPTFKLIKLANGKIVKLNKKNVVDKFDLIETDEETKINYTNFSNPPEIKKKKTNETCSKVKTIVIQDEEYIQMPKSLYMKERIELLNKIEYYKSVLNDFKEKLNDMDFS